MSKQRLKLILKGFHKPIPILRDEVRTRRWTARPDGCRTRCGAKIKLSSHCCSGRSDGMMNPWNPKQQWLHGSGGGKQCYNRRRLLYRRQFAEVKMLIEHEEEWGVADCGVKETVIFLQSSSVRGMCC
ncbi:hypothetical protein CEXT_325731 [Caerostris extrusa]|uniref:Uncharacterized protein n=1 Tax=Caerostris extrusa TaxID=172846 RepID=A0AAV4M8Z0_CAEEX|nr:hypothetical protein CEXT_325731 [Caerostris extrusa]